MKTLVLITSILTSSLIFGQSNFYKKDGKKIPIIGEQVKLEFTSDIALERPPENEEGFAETLVATLLPSAIDLGFKVSNSLIEKKLKKFTSEFSARNTYMNEDKYITGFTIIRNIKNEDKNEKELAFSAKFQPIKVNDNTFVFAISEMVVNSSGAKTKKGYNNNDYTLEIKVSYYDGKEKKEQTSGPITIQLFEIQNQNYQLTYSSSNYTYLSDKFPLNPNFNISEVSVKIVETNTAKVKAEKIKSLHDKYSEDAKGLAKNIVNFYIEKSKESEEDEN